MKRPTSPSRSTPSASDNDSEDDDFMVGKLKAAMPRNPRRVAMILYNKDARETRYLPQVVFCNTVRWLTNTFNGHKCQ